MSNDTKTDERAEALSKHLEIPLDDVSEQDWGEHFYDAGGLGEWLVLTDEEADERTEDYIRGSVWAFVPSFLAAYMPDGIGPDDVRALRGDKCESVNDAFLAMIEAGSGFERFVEDAIAADGRGHFLSHYDSEEVEAGDLFLYRTN